MKRIIIAVTLCIAAAGCAVPAHIRNALEIQARYTNLYVEKTLPLIKNSGLPDSEELEGIGKRLVRNANALVQQESN